MPLLKLYIQYIIHTMHLSTTGPWCAHRPRLCKFGGARMAHKAKDRVTNQEFPSCHSWERNRRQKLRIKRFSLQKKTRKATHLQQSFVKDITNLHVSRCFKDIGWEESCFLCCIYFSLCRPVCTMVSFRNLNGQNGSLRELLPAFLWSFGFLLLFLLLFEAAR